MADWFWDLILLYVAGATIAAFLINIISRYYNIKADKGNKLSEDDVDGIVLGTIFWPIVVPLGGAFLILRWIFNIIDKTSIAIAAGLTNKE
jgi:ABC-type maltose transport system permease subunit